ncbi:Cysteine protease atg4b [Mortierella sp. GBA30]|nr:Cysteine protease atg4b [Mortierella sp. GBA30]
MPFSQTDDSSATAYQRSRPSRHGSSTPEPAYRDLERGQRNVHESSFWNGHNYAGTKSTRSTAKATTSATGVLVKNTDEHVFRDDVEFWASLYAQHPVSSQQDSSVSPPSPQTPREHNRSRDQGQIKILQVLTKVDLEESEGISKESHGSGRFQFDRLSNNTSRHSSSSTATLHCPKPFSVVLFFTVEELVAPSENARKHLSTSSTKILWLFTSAIFGTSTVLECTELMGSFSPSHLNHVREGVAPFYIYETRTLDLRRSLKDRSVRVLDLIIFNPEGTVHAELSYTLSGHQGSLTTEQIRRRPYQALEQQRVGNHDAIKIESKTRKPRRRDTVATTSVSAELESASGYHRGGHRGVTRFDTFEEGYDLEEPVLEPPLELGSTSVAQEPVAGEHFMQATSEFFSKMGYWLYNSRVVQYIARDERNRTKTSFPAQDIWMLGVCYSFQPNHDEEEEQQEDDSNPVDKGSNTPEVVSSSSAVELPAITKSAEPGSRHGQSHNLARSLSQCTTVSAQRSSATSSISHQEAQSHSHTRYQSISRGVSGSDAPAIIPVDSTAISSPHRSTSTSAQGPTLVSPGDSKTKAMTSRLSKLSLGSRETNTHLTPENQLRSKTTSDSLVETDDLQTDQSYRQGEPTLPNSRRSGRRRMTMSEIFSRDSNTNSISIPNTDIGNMSIPALNSPPGSSSREETSPQDNATSRSRASGSVNIETPGMDNMENVSLSSSPSLSTLSITTPITGMSSLVSIPEISPTGGFEDERQEHAAGSYGEESRLAYACPPSAGGDDGLKRERKRKTSKTPITQGTGGKEDTSSAGKQFTINAFIELKVFYSIHIYGEFQFTITVVVIIVTIFTVTIDCSWIWIRAAAVLEIPVFVSCVRKISSTPRIILAIVILQLFTDAGHLTPEQETLRLFMMDFQSRLWFTYRKDLARIEPSFYTCDSGWGCMMRTGQSLLAQGFIQVMVGRDWRAHLPQTHKSHRRYRRILNWFVDEPEREYSIHRIAKAGLALDKRIGEWFGPATVAHALRSIKWKPVMLMIPTRFGLEKLTAKYTTNLKQLFKIPQFLGIAGGRPGRSLYFVACQGDDLFYYDPHFVKPRAASEELGACPVPGFHCPVVRAMDILELDPSMLLGFMIRTQDELEDLMDRLEQDMEQAYPLLTIVDDLPQDAASPTGAPEAKAHQGSIIVHATDLHELYEDGHVLPSGGNGTTYQRDKAEKGHIEGQENGAPPTLKDVGRDNIEFGDDDDPDMFSVKSLNSDAEGFEDEDKAHAFMPM